MAQLVLSVAGAGVGFLLGGPAGAQIGFAAGSMAYSALAPNTKVEGPRLADLKAPQASYGAPICYVEGAPRLAGTIIWASDKREIATTTEQGGKGAPGVDSTTYTYEIDVLFELTINPMAGVRRIWKHGELIWNVSDDAAEATLQASVGTTTPDAGDAVIATGQTDHWRELRVYSGASDQMPDPTYEAAVGAGNAPAYRGRGTVMIEGLQLGAGGQMPVLTFEVFTSGTGSLPVVIDLGDFLLTGNDSSITFSGPEYLPGSGGFSLDATVTANSFLTNVHHDIINITNDFSAGDYVRLRMNGPPINANESFILDDAIFGDLVFDFPGGYSPGTPFAMSFVGSAPDTNNTSTISIYRDGVLRATSGYRHGSSLGPATSGSIRIGEPSLATNGYNVRVDDVVFRSLGATGFSADTEPLSEVVERLCVRAGLAAADLDVTALAGIPVRAMAVSQVTPTRQVLDMLAQAYLFEFVEGDKLRAVLRGGASVATIPFADLGASNGEPGEPLPLRRVNDIELPAQVSIKYANTLNDFQDGAESGDRLVTDSTAVSVIELPLGMTPTEAKRLADVATTDIAASMLAIGPVAVTREHAKLEPTDVVTLTAESGSTFRARVLKINDASGVRTMDLTLDDATAINSVAATDSSYTSSTLVRPLADTDLELLDIPILRDADDAPGIYVAFGATGKWPGAALIRSVDDIEWAEVTRATDRAVMGEATTALADWAGGNVFDEASSVTVDVGTGTLSSVTRDQILNDRGRNALLIGDEIVQFRDADLQSAGVYILTGFLRGRRGTERAMATHGTGDRVVLLRTTGLRRVGHEQSEVGVLRYWKGVTFGKSLASAATHEFTDTGAALKPFAPVHVAASRASDGAITLEWTRRTRLATRFVGTAGINVPLGEDSEAYSVDVMDGDTVVRTLTSSSEAVTYSAADQVTDFGSTQASVTVRVHQLSDTVGRGYAAEATV